MGVAERDQRRIVQTHPAPAEARTLMRGYLERSLNSPDPVYRRYQDTLWQEGCRGFATAHNTTTPAQRDVAVRRLKAYQRDALELAGK